MGSTTFLRWLDAATPTAESGVFSKTYLACAKIYCVGNARSVRLFNYTYCYLFDSATGKDPAYAARRIKLTFGLRVLRLI